jgi:hypothetical protein
MLLDTSRRGAAPVPCTSFSGYAFPLGVPGADSAPAALIRDAAARALFSPLGDPLPQDRRLNGAAKSLLAKHLQHVASGKMHPAEGVSGATANVMVLGNLDEVERELVQTGGLHAWGHFVAKPARHAEAVAAFTAADGVTRVYIATAWRA